VAIDQREAPAGYDAGNMKMEVVRVAEAMK
jgi:hypothetical protein